MLRADDGQTVEVQVPEEVRDRCDVGGAARVEFEGDGTVARWELTDAS